MKQAERGRGRGRKRESVCSALYALALLCQIIQTQLLSSTSERDLRARLCLIRKGDAPADCLAVQRCAVVMNGGEGIKLIGTGGRYDDANECV